MKFDRASATRYLRALLVLGRTSNLPTVWSNCLAGWLLGGEGAAGRFALLSAGATFLYLAGTYWNDAFDAQFDQQHRPERPIPSGAISLGSVWRWGLAWLVLGVLSLGLLGKTTCILAALLALSIFIYDAIHKIFAFSPFLVAGCRFLLILLAASAAKDGVTGGLIPLAFWSALVLGVYVVGVSFLARKESTRGPIHSWPCALLAAPVVLALVVNRDGFRWHGYLFSAVLVVWVVVSLRHVFLAAQPNIGRSVPGLLAGIVLVDLLAVAGGTLGIGLVFLMLFVLALIFQQFIPAT